jgi:hypothetical protein
MDPIDPLTARLLGWGFFAALCVVWWTIKGRDDGGGPNPWRPA